MTKIPQLAHWIWFGDDTPAWVTQNIDTFSRFHPNWEMRIWHELPEHFPDDLRQIINHLPWYSSRSDIFRYWLLAKYGGVYCDADIITLRNFDPLRCHDYFLAPCQPTGHTTPHLNCALMGSIPDARAAHKILEGCRIRFANPEESRRVTYGPELLTGLFGINQTDVTILPLHYFYVIPDQETTHAYWRADSQERARIMRTFQSQFTDSEAPYAIHLWGVEGSSQCKVINFCQTYSGSGSLG